MVRIADIKSSQQDTPYHCDLILSGDTSVREAIDKMEELGFDYVAIREQEKVLSKKDLLKSLLDELDQAQDTLQTLYNKFEFEISEHIDMLQNSIKSIADTEKNKLQVAIDHMAEGMIILDRNGEVENANPSAKILLGLESNSGLDVLSGTIDRIGFRNLILSKDSEQGSKNGEIKLKAPGSKILQLRWNQMLDELDNFFGYVVMIRNITEETAAEMAKSEFIAAISHELRTPLTSIQNCVSNMQAGVTGRIPMKMRNYLHVMKQDCHRFADLINDLLDMSKLETGSMPINRRVTNMNSIIMKVIDHFSHEAEVKSIELKSSVTEHISPVYADPKRIEQVLHNLISNAIKFTGPGGKVTIKCHDSQDSVITVVEDTGVGISHDLQKLIFDKFYQIDRQAGPGYKGSGLGLAICSGIVAAHNGSVWVESDKEKGSKFFFSIPKTDPHQVLNKHLSALAHTPAAGPVSLALAIVHLDIPDDAAPQCTEPVGMFITQLLAESDKFMTDNNDLAIQTDLFEAVFVIKSTKKDRINTVITKLCKIVANHCRKYFKDLPIVPMLAVGQYPADSCQIGQLETLTRKKFERV